MKQSIGSGRGSVYNIIMKALQSGDKYGYEICQEVEEKTNGNYILKQPSLYSGLKRLESQKCVESYWGDSEIGGRRHYYKLTELGKQRLEQSNFSWEDERNDLVENFFKKTEAEQNINDLQNELSSLTDILEGDTKTTEKIQNLFEQNAQQTTDFNTNEQFNAENSEKTEKNNVVSTKEELNQKQDMVNQTIVKNGKNSFVHKVNENQFDLFSFASVSIQNSDDSNNESCSNIVSNEKDVNDNPNIDVLTQNSQEENLNKNKTINIKENTNKNVENLVKKGVLNEEKSSTLYEGIKTSEENIINANENEEYNEQKHILNEERFAINTKLNETSKENKKYYENSLYNQNISLQQETDELQFEEIFSRKRAVSFSDKFEENDVSPIFKTDLEKSSTYYGSTNANDENTQNINDDFEEKYAQFQKTFEQDNISENKEQIVSSSNVCEMNKQENNEEELRKLQEIRMSEILSGNFDDAQKNIENINSQIENGNNNQDFDVNNNEGVEELYVKNEKLRVDSSNQENSAILPQNNEKIMAEDSTHGLNLSEIFKDIIDSSNSGEKTDNQNYDEYNNINFNTQTNLDESLIKDNDLLSREENVDSLPRYDLSDNVNFSLDSSSYKKENNFEKYNSQNFDNSTDLEKLDNFNKHEIPNTYFSVNYENEVGGKFDEKSSENNEFYSHLSFDKKQRMRGTNFNNYEIRYLRKNNLEQKSTNFTAINRLNLTTNLIISLIALIITAGLYFGLKPLANFSSLQKGMFIANIVIIVLFGGISSIISLSDKNKRIIYSFEKSLFVNAIFLGLLFSAIVLCSNLLFGMQMNKIISYCGSFILPVLDALFVMLIPVLKFMLNKISYYTK